MPFQDSQDAQERQPSKRSFVQHSIDRPGMIVTIGKHLKITENFRCLVHSISCAGAVINISPKVELPKTFFLVLHGSTEEIGATEFRRDGETAWIRFNMFLDADYLRSLVRGQAMPERPAD